MSSPLAEAFLLVTLNNCYETPFSANRSEKTTDNIATSEQRLTMTIPNSLIRRNDVSIFFNDLNSI